MVQVLDRIKYLLTSAAAPAALQPLLSLLGELALGGADVAHAICEMPGLVSSSLMTSCEKGLLLSISLLCPCCGRHCCGHSSVKNCQTGLQQDAEAPQHSPSL